MVHVLSNLLHKVHQSLRPNGLLLLFQPDAAHKVVELTVDESVSSMDTSRATSHTKKDNNSALVRARPRPIFKEAFEEPNFMSYLLATHTVIEDALTTDLFVKEKEMTVPTDGTYNHHDYGTIDTWEKEYGWLTDDPEALVVFAEKMRGLVDGRDHHVRSYSRDYELLLRKV